MALPARAYAVDATRHSRLVHAARIARRRRKEGHGRCTRTELVVAQTPGRVLVPVQERVPHQILFIFPFAGDVREELLPHFFNKSPQHRRKRSVRPCALRNGRLRLQEMNRSVDHIFNQQVVGHLVLRDRSVGGLDAAVVAD